MTFQSVRSPGAGFTVARERAGNKTGAGGFPALNETMKGCCFMRPIRSVLVALVATVVVGALASASASAHEWFKNGSPLTKTEEVTISGGTLELHASSVDVITCKSDTGKGTVGTGSAGEVAEIKWTGCTTSESGCSVKSTGQPNGTIVAVHLPTQLTERENTEHVNVVADELKENATTMEFTTLKFTQPSEGGCFNYPAETKIYGEVAGAVHNATSEIIFPSTALKENNLEGFGKKLKFVTAYTQTLTHGGILSAN